MEARETDAERNKTVGGKMRKSRRKVESIKLSAGAANADAEVLELADVKFKFDI